jgi:mannose-6-phosphate isomerase
MNRPERIHLLENPIRPYAWGSRTALAELQGRPAPSAEPEAELWVGAHPLAPSRVVADGERIALDQWIARAREVVLGPELARQFGSELPFLVKILAVERPLSLQAHPDAAQARAGYEREERAGIPRSAPERSYRDPHPKPELVCALRPFGALTGFRPPQEILARFERLGVARLEPTLTPLRRRTDAVGWREAFRALLELAPGDLGLAVGEAAAAATQVAGDAGLAWLPRLAEAYPGDPGALAPVFLRFVELAPGEALFLPAGELHSYLYGVAVEVMANSDNVLRAGLTSKHVDREDLLAVMRFEVACGDRLLPKTTTPGVSDYDVPATEFRLERLGPAEHVGSGGRLEVLLCTEGEADLRPVGPGPQLLLGAGRAALVPAASAGYRLSARGVVHRVTVPGSARTSANPSAQPTA